MRCMTTSSRLFSLTSSFHSIWLLPQASRAMAANSKAEALMGFVGSDSETRCCECKRAPAKPSAGVGRMKSKTYSTSIIGTVRVAW